MSDFDHTTDGARAAAERGELARWIGDFLRSPGSDNADLGDELESSGRVWAGPVRLPFDQLHRLAGPPDQPALDDFDGDDRERIEDMEESIEDDDWEPAPLIVTRRDDQFVVEDGNHRIEGLRRAGHDSWWSVVGFDDDAARDRFEADEDEVRRRSD